MAKSKLNVDVSGAVSEFESAIKEFKLRDVIYRTVFRGRGLEFDSYRTYSPDEDASNIDWKASMRANNLLVRKYIEERDLKIVFVVDVSEKMIFGSSKKLKCEYMTEVIAALSHLIITSKDNVSLVMYNEKVTKVIPLGKSLDHFSIFVDELSNPDNYGSFSSFNAALDYVMKYYDDSISAVIFVSDFIGLNSGVEEKLSLVASRFETMALMIKDPLDYTLPEIDGEVLIQDPGTGKRILINPRVARRQYELFALAQEKLVKDLFKKYSVDLLSLKTTDSFVLPLANFLTERVLEGVI